MKHLLKNAAIFVALLLTVAFTGCKNPSSNDDGNSKSKLDAPTNLVVNSITDNTISCAANITFNYNGKFEGATKAILGYSTTNDSSKAVYDTYNSTATVEAGENTRTVNYTGSYYFKPTSGKKYYFWLKVTSSAYNVSDSSWSNVAEFTCP
ncbi:hypothetical protein E4N72_10460 [Treponema vincentii]|uniref:hypothetical protein n=1 Tax=Treponema vincentii TaxID=69710 RepID=UPI0020A56068|nr:hypothetical protein [Treponema vincentii]UTC46934.1 hypothetical protein E4N72_10460 [Treponema vincentii]